jgi:hypothetical protein
MVPPSTGSSFSMAIFVLSGGAASSQDINTNEISSISTSKNLLLFIYVLHPLYHQLFASVRTI